LEKHQLSKSTFLRGLQCTKSLYLYKNFINLRDQPSSEQKAIFDRGNKIGLIAQQLFPGGTDATPSKRSDYRLAVENTQLLISQGVEVIYEAAFQYNGVLAILDILVKEKNQWYAYEVKSATKISNAYLLDASLQYWVITNSGLSLDDISLVFINNQYIRNGEVNPNELFSRKSVKEIALKQQDKISNQVMELKQVIANPEMPPIAIGEHCFIPYNCDFMGTCWKHIPKNSIFEVAGIARTTQFNLHQAGYTSISEVPSKNELDKNLNIHINAVKSAKILINQEEIKLFLTIIQYPLYFIDFESFMPAIPLYDKTKPYQHIPFQYSLHYKITPDAPLQHVAFLAEQGIDPRKLFIENLLNHLQTSGTILVYDALMERNILNGLKKDFPEYNEQIEAILKRIIDLSTPFQNRSYYHPAMKNSFSIKNVLPALAPGFSYDNLLISSGSIAMTAFEQLQTETDLIKIIEIREQLLEYCKLDTLAMVKIFEVLEKVVDKKS
jgi:predicted RecB family nuclease